MKQDDYGHQIEQYIAAHGPVSAAEIVEGVGCSRQRVYTWLQRNRPRLRAQGITTNGATRRARELVELTRDATGPALSRVPARHHLRRARTDQ